MGEVRTSVHSMLAAQGEKMEVEYKDGVFGHLSADDCSIEERPTFCQFIAGGCEISVVVAIDFTSSNGDVSVV